LAASGTIKRRQTIPTASNAAKRAIDPNQNITSLTPYRVSPLFGKIPGVWHKDILRRQFPRAYPLRMAIREKLFDNPPVFL